jgi:hypothetical protein
LANTPEITRTWVIEFSDRFRRPGPGIRLAKLSASLLSELSGKHVEDGLDGFEVVGTW